MVRYATRRLPGHPHGAPMTYTPEPTPDPDASGEGPGAGGRRGLGCLLEILETLVLTLVIYLLIHNFVAQPFEVEQSSMVPTIVQHEYVLIDKISPHIDDYRRGDIVVFDPPAGFEQGGVPFIKRVIGLPGETVSLDNGHVYVTPPGGVRVRLEEPYVIRGVNGAGVPTVPRDVEGTASWVVPAGDYFVLGDNRTVSQDSRFFGPIARSSIVGRAWLRYFPIGRIGFLDRPTYAGLPAQPGASPTALWPYPFGGSSATIQLSMLRP
ncbi:MAG TPA: signal peptidase I [Candidatus Saccharimonadales bacterium]|nr:signal peptidase I [Candidatus Saccharimonadales bacterium]